MPLKISQIHCRHFNWSPNQMEWEVSHARKGEESTGKQGPSTALCPLGRMRCLHSFSAEEQSFPAARVKWSRLGRETLWQNSKHKNTKIDNGICFYVRRDFSSHKVILVFEYIIKYDSLFTLAHLQYDATLV